MVVVLLVLVAHGAAVQTAEQVEFQGRQVEALEGSVVALQSNLEELQLIVVCVQVGYSSSIWDPSGMHLRPWAAAGHMSLQDLNRSTLTLPGSCARDAWPGPFQEPWGPIAH